jgi:hypothetical protein
MWKEFGKNCIMRSYAKYNYRDKFKEDGMDKESSMGV